MGAEENFMYFDFGGASWHLNVNGLDADSFSIFQFHSNVHVGVFATTNLDDGKPWPVARKLLPHGLHPRGELRFDIAGN